MHANFDTGFNKLSKRPKGLFLYGSFETGKTLWVSQFMVDEPKFYVGDWKQFHLYRNERIIVFEDFAEENVQFYPSKRWFKPTNQPMPYYYIAYYCFFDYSRESRWHTETLAKKLKIYDN